MKIGFIGSGNMGGAVAAALSSNKAYEVYVYDINTSFCQEFCKSIGVTQANSLEDLFSKAQTLVIAVKPQVLGSLYPVFAQLGSKDHSWISLAAGVPLQVLSAKLGTKNVVRFMSNLAAKYKAAVTAVCPCEGCDSTFSESAMAIASLFGEAFPLEERLFGAFIGVSASAIAYVLQFIHALGMGATDQGIAYPTAIKMASATLKSAWSLFEAQGENPVSLMTKVCSAGGTTIKGMEALAKGGFDSCVEDAVVKASQKALELEDKAKQDL